jgi:hypothetical protein
MFTIDDIISTVNWLERLARVAKDTGKPMPECMSVHDWSDVNVLLNTKANAVNLMSELAIMVKMFESRQAELKSMLDDKV